MAKRSKEEIYKERREKLEADERALVHRKLMLRDESYAQVHAAWRSLGALGPINDPHEFLQNAEDYLRDMMDLSIASYQNDQAAPTGQEEADGVV